MAHLGSFSAAVDLPEYLRPWAEAGIESLFFPDGAPFEALSAPGAEPERARPANAADHPAPPASEPSSPAETGAPNWPEPWLGLARHAPANPAVVITYAALYDDMTGKGDPVRRKVFRAVLKYLAWPRGTTLFWPVCAPEDTESAAQDVFVQGVALFNVTHIAAFGVRAVELCAKLYPHEANPTVAVHALPEPEELDGLLPHEFQMRLGPLKALKFA